MKDRLAKAAADEAENMSKENRLIMAAIKFLFNLTIYTLLKICAVTIGFKRLVNTCIWEIQHVNLQNGEICI